MQRLRINWLFKILVPGYLFILASALIAEAYLFSVTVFWQEIIIAGLIAYLFILLIKKYKNLLLFSTLICSLFAGIFYFKNQINISSIDQESLIKIYPDQIRIQDDWLSGKAFLNNKESILIKGKINKNVKKQLESGSTIIIDKIKGDINQIEPATNPGEFNYQKYYESKGILQQIKLSQFNLKKIDHGCQAKIHQLRFNIQCYFKKLPRLLSFFASELVLAEDNSQDNKVILNNYRDLGIIHLLSISGLHVGLYTLMITSILYSFKFTNRESFLCCVVVLLIEIFLSQGQAGFVRASLSYILANFLKFKKLKITGFDLLALTALIHLFFQPKLFTTTGAILSYLLVFGLQLTKNLNTGWQSLALNSLINPILLLFFYQINLFTIFFNFLAIPYFNKIVVPSTFSAIVLYPILPGLCDFIERILEITENTVGKISQTKFGIIVFGQINWYQCLILLLFTVLILALIVERNSWHIKIAKKLIFGCGAAYLGIFISIHCPIYGQVSFIDVGQGDSILITTPFPRRTYLIDTGGKLNFSGKKIEPQVNRITIPVLKAKGINKIDAIFVSHQDADHVGDLKPLLDKIKVDRLYMAKGLIKNPSFQKRVINATHTELIEVLAGMSIKEPKINFDFVYPFREGEGKNEDSLSLTFELAGKKWLFTGDLGQEGEKEIIQKFSNLKVDYFKLGHHGSKTSSNPDFLQAINPKLVFISAGRNNRFGHPHQETLTTLKSQGIPWVSTQDCGMISWYYSDLNFKPFFTYFLKEQKQ